MSIGLRPYRFACERCNWGAAELHFTYINRQPCHVCHDCLRELIAANVARVAARARAAGRLGGEVSAEEEA
jgi:protein-arginine kinase activator protein McsA